VAGARRADGRGFANTIETLKTLGRSPHAAVRHVQDPVLHSTTLALVATNAKFNKTALTKIAMMASTGAARAINPYHTNGDGDSTFAVSANKLDSDLGISVIGALAAEAVSEAVLRAVRAARSVEGWPSASDYKLQGAKTGDARAPNPSQSYRAKNLSIAAQDKLRGG